MSDFPPEILSDIFYRLPVISLLRLRCVSKRFLALIDSPHFIRSHLNRSLKTNSNQSLIFKSSDGLHSMDFDLFQKSFRTFFVGGFRVVGSSNGLLCLTWGVNVYLGNPCFRNVERLPRNKINFYEWAKIRGIVYGFGYDHVKDDYMVVRVVNFEAAGQVMIQNEVKVYSVKSYTWRRVKDFPYILYSATENGVFVNGAFHWIVTVKPKLGEGRVPVSHKIVSFDIVTEEYHSIPLPEYTPYDLDEMLMMILWELGGKLCVHCRKKNKYLDVWVMDSYGIVESWTKLYSMAQPNVSERLVCVTAVAYSKDGEKILLDDPQLGRLVWYDLKLGTVENIKMPNGTISCSQQYIHTDSLIKVTSVKLKIKSGARTNLGKQGKKGRKRKTPPMRNHFPFKGLKLRL